MGADFSESAFGPCPDEADLPRLFESANSADIGVARAAQAELFAYLWHTHQPFVSWQARRDWGNGLSTQDLALTVIRQMLVDFEGYSDRNTLSLAFRRKIVSRAIDHYRRQVRQRRAAERWSNSRGAAEPKEHTDELERLDLVGQMIQALREHNPKWAAAIELRYLAVDDSCETYKAIGRALGVTDTTAQDWVTRGTDWLRAKYAGQRLF